MAPRERVLTVRELNRALLARQLLLRRARIGVPHAIERVGALQAQWPRSPYIALWTRLEGFTHDRFVRPVERRQVVRRPSCGRRSTTSRRATIARTQGYFSDTGSSRWSRAETEAPPRFLPMWDSVLLAHSDRSRILPEAYRKAVICRNGDVQRTFLVDGFVAGTWNIAGGRVALEPFEALSRDTRRRLEQEGEALARFHAGARSGVRE